MRVLLESIHKESTIPSEVYLKYTKAFNRISVYSSPLQRPELLRKRKKVRTTLGGEQRCLSQQLLNPKLNL